MRKGIKQPLANKIFQLSSSLHIFQLLLVFLFLLVKNFFLLIFKNFLR
jgi:hypothetical protein